MFGWKREYIARYVVSQIIFVSVSGCDPTLPAKPAQYWKDYELTIYYGELVRADKSDVRNLKTIEDEIYRRHLLTVADVVRAKNRTIFIGMNESEIFATLGSPWEVLWRPRDDSVAAWVFSPFTRVHVMETAQNEVHDVNVGDGELGGTILFVKNGRVTGFRAVEYEFGIEIHNKRAGSTFFIPSNLPPDWFSSYCHFILNTNAVALNCVR